MDRILRVTFLLLLLVQFNISPIIAFASPKKVAAGISDYRFETVNIDWWDNFDDPYLKEYVSRTVKQNHDLKIATLKSKQAYQNVKSTLANELPQVSLIPSYARIRTPGFDFNGLNLDATSTNIFAFPVIASYEADIFLKNHDKTTSAKKQYNAVIYEEKALFISTVSSTAAAYLNVVKLDKLIELQEDIVKLRKEIFLLTDERNKAGLSSTFDTTLTDKQHTIAMIELNDLKKQRALMLHQLAYLIGENPSCAGNIKRMNLDEIEYRGRIPHCISSDVVVNRPDLLKAEAEIEKARIDVKVARKEFLPTIPIVGVVGFNSLTLSRLFDWRSFLAMVGVAAIQNLYTGGRKTALLKTKKFKYEEMFENYKRADLQAIQEVNDCLCQIKFDTVKDNDNAKKFDLENRNFGLITERYNYGITSYFDMIQFRENLLTLRKDMTDSKTQRLIDYLSLYKAVGGAL